MLKRLINIFFSIIMLVLFSWVIILSIFLASIDTSSFGLFLQERVGQYGKTFNIFKIRTINDKTSKISKFGLFLRKSKLDELPQLLNILLGQMSFVGPRPDIPGYYDLLKGEDRKILELKPGLTSEASLKYYNEESVLQNEPNPTVYNDTVIFPDKVRMNLEYYYNHSIYEDLRIIFKTISKFFRK
ncbi:sugar transferase [Aequorivita antarctica]|uniref:Sugar transferase n=1 Tax=Aequorivita antarctica TaxID=153266 RepID=A0A5C6Z2S6_9FLAO|nr:sugar transferase [Aequorivita antarctica]TXD73691.1 sugar transferase [Aequorivita antarctica]SRX75866.1 putative sugar transferase EpsL [Aequorivita antarctica]